MSVEDFFYKISTAVLLGLLLLLIIPKIYRWWSSKTDGWFALENGILSHFKSQEEVNHAYKGSIKMAGCDINIYNSDKCRLDLVIPGEQHLYIKAPNPHERQQWLISLEPAKASLTSGWPATQSDKFITVKGKMCAGCYFHHVCNQKLDEATSLIGVLCNTFISTLEDCMKVANASIGHGSPRQQTSDSPSPVISLKTRQKRDSRSHSFSERNPPGQSSIRRTLSDSNSTRATTPEKPIPRPPLADVSQKHLNQVAGTNDLDNTNHEQFMHNSEQKSETDSQLRHSTSSKSHEHGEDDFKDSIDKRVPNFISAMQCSFMNLKLESDGGIPTEHFLASCSSMIPIFDKLNATAFAPVKMDFQGNIRKLQQKFSTNTSSFSTLQRMILSEVNAKQHHLSSSATLALLWMKRGLLFIIEFLKEILSEQQDMSLAAENAYSRSLKPYHGYIVRGVFAVAVKALPYREVFMSHMSLTGDTSEGSDFYPFSIGRHEEPCNSCE